MTDMSDKASLDNVPRVHSPSPEKFLEQYVRTETPVILTSLLEGQPILALSSARAAAAVLADIPLRAIEVTENFVKPPQVRSCTFGEYSASVAEDPACDLWCYQPLPKKLARMVRLPDYVDKRRHAFSTWLYVSNARPPLSLHFDVDFRHNLMTQIFGRKRYSLISPRYSKRLNPYFNYSLAALTNYSEAEKTDFLRYNCAYDCILHPGETLFIPRSWWHYVEYLEFSMSISVRYASTPFDGALSRLPLSYFLQNVANRLVDDADGKVMDPEAYKELFDSYYRPAAGPVALYRRAYATQERLYKELCRESLQGTYVSDDFNLEHRKLKSGRSLWGRLRCPPSYEGGNPDAPLSRSQLAAIRRHLKESPKASRESRMTFAGEKKRLDDFTRLEAAHLMDRLSIR